MKSLRIIYQEHKGKVSDKWELYLDVYDRVFAHWRELPVTLVEVGVQNGGSLEIWPQFFSKGVAFIGCDIDPKCASLRYEDPRISVVVGNINSGVAAQALRSHARSCDIFIDDGSHASHDIILSFINYFQFIKPGGLYVIEDIHCSYWSSHEGGIVCASSSMNFFKLVCDVLNYQHWQSQIAIESLLSTFFPGKKCPDYSVFSEIFSMTFYNSMCVIEKCREGLSSSLGQRIIVGDQAMVSSEPLKLRTIPAPAQG